MNASSTPGSLFAVRVSTAALFLVLDVETHENYQNYQKHDMEGKVGKKWALLA